MIVLDLEWNRGYDRTPLSEILQIGAVRLDRLGGPIVDTFNVFIRPRVHKKFDLGAKKLPELAACKASTIDFATAFAAFRDWCGQEEEFAGWGPDDLETLQQSCDYWKVPCIRAAKTYDFQAAFSRRVGIGQQVALHNVVAYCGIPAPFEFHNALHDALYTALLGEWLTMDLLTQKDPPRVARKFCQEPFPPQPRQRVGPFPTPETAMDSKLTRRPTCPLCGKSWWVREWHFSGPGQYYGAFRCPTHGRFLCRLALSPQEDGQWRGRVSVPPLTSILLQEYAVAVKKGHSHQCRASRPKNRRWRVRQEAAAAPPSPPALSL